MISCCSCWQGLAWLEPGGLKQFHNPGDFLLIGIMKPITNIKSCGLKRQPERGWDVCGPHGTPPAPRGQQPLHFQVSAAHPGPSSCVMSFVGSLGRKAGSFGVCGERVAPQGVCCMLGLRRMICGCTKLGSHYPSA